jgi:hypothetical protein
MTDERRFPKDIFWIGTAAEKMALDKQRIKDKIAFYELQLYATKERLKQLKEELKGY